jgi:hypothetical protein
MPIWQGVRGPSNFEIDGDGSIHLGQRSDTGFILHSTIEYSGATGLEGKVSDTALAAARVVGPQLLSETDLASVPASLQWFVGKYGVHTPAALIHDVLIGDNDKPLDEITDALADRYWRFMLADLGVPWLRRWLMWTAVAFGTRYRRSGWSRWSLWIWVLASVAGTVLFLIGISVGIMWMWILAFLLPIPFSLLWGKQCGAGLLGAYYAPFVLPPTILGSVGILIYKIVEGVISVIKK